MTVRLDVVGVDDWPDAVAGELAARLRASPDLRLCLPTGDTPEPLYAALAALAGAGAAPFGRAHLILLDEYLGLPPDDPAGGDARLRRELVDRLDPPPAAYHGIDAAAPDPEAEAARHDAVAARGIDLALVGLGLNGHIGFNEPGSTADSPTRVVRLARSSREVATESYGAEEVPTAGITLGMARLLAAGEIWLLVTGEHKAEILRRALEGPIGPDCPASLLREHAALRVFADAPAAAELAGSA